MVNILPQVSKLGSLALNLLYPQRCIGCGQEGEMICSSCSHSLPRIKPPLCPRCGLPQVNGVICSKCNRQPMEIDGIRSPFRLDGVIRQAVYQLKYNNIRTLATPLARLLYEFIIENPIPGEILVPVPLHSKRLRERGYNQSALIARQLSKMLDIPVVNDCLFRQRHTPSQATSTNIAQRQSNVRHAFSSQHDGLKDKQVILIDDVATSGATLNACANTLKTAGVASVWGLVLARET